jgi:hypothetical protein
MRKCYGDNRALAEATKTSTQDIVEKPIVLVNPKRRGKHKKEARSLNNLLLDAVDETLRHVFKEEGANFIFHYLENKCRLNRRRIAEEPEDFSAGLERFLGSAAPVMEKMILKNLYSKLELKFEEKEGYKFSDYVKELREK